MDENQSRYGSTWYGTGGVAIKTALAGGALQYSTTNTLDGTGRIQSVSLVDPLGTTTTQTFTASVGRNRLTSVSRPSANGLSTVSQTLGYDVNGNVVQATDFNGNLTCAVFDLTRNLETGRVEGFAPGSTCPGTISTYTPVTGTVQRKILTLWHATWHLPAKRAEPLKITTWVYNGDGGVYCAPTTAKVGNNPIGVLCSRSEQGTTDATGGTGFGATATGSPRVWSYTYNSFGQVVTADGPRTDVVDKTTFAYYTCTTGAQCGQLNTISNALGHVTTFLTYNGHGQPLTISDPNGVVKILTYDSRERLKSISVGTETTGFSYYPTGLLNTVTLPDSSTVQYGYDAAHRLTDITDGIANHIHYTLDAMGNRKSGLVYDSSNALHRSHSRNFDALNHVYQDVNSAGTAAVTTTYVYDNNDNLTTIDAPLSRNTIKAYDALNRLSQITDPASGITKLGHDAHDQLTSVIDPRTFTTSYTVDSFGEITKQSSPDTGTANKTYDPAGNLKTASDARSALATYTYDALNRETQVAYSDQTITYTYDTGTNGKGHLTAASDANHSMSWGYDTLGRVTSKAQTVAGVAKSVGYGYTNGDMTSLVTASGQTITYGYTNHRITSIRIGSTTLLSGVTYDPLGPPTAWTWGNSTTVSRAFDQDGLPHQLVSAGVTYGNTPDSASRITGITDSGLSSDSFTYGYDLLDRVTSGTSTLVVRGYTYDANSNRKTTTGTTASTERIASASNHLSSTNGGVVRTYGYDAAGNTTSYTGDTFTFNQRGRMSSSTVSAGATNYIYNALGQLIEKSGNGGTTLLVYDEAGHLLGEYSSTGALIQETIWIGDLPVATLQITGGVLTTYYVHADHLGTPRKITRPSDNALMWRWDPDTFGSVAPTSTGITYNLRFPGQYSLPESGLYYNYFRTYDPQMGRYIEADPIGLKGGINPYAYVNGNPISRIDPLGLLTISLGYYGSSVLGFGGNVGGGVYVNYSGGQLSYGTYVSGGAGAGLNVSAGGQLGIYSGGLDTFSGRTNVISGGTEAISGGVVYNTSGDLVGTTLSIGPTLSPINYSVTAEVTGIISNSNKPKPAACP